MLITNGVCSIAKVMLATLRQVTVSKSSESKVTERAYSLWKESLNEIARFTKSSDFYFKGVSV